ncbi:MULTISPECIES: hypothetical protein [unclassified Streptomyces]|uniref:hypothetical protein n=1 Tax=unclassified Streptomyces TaxID=2593676 RepID=UPI002365B04C|nr:MULTISPECIES: hypothetical protein [unclassified Streptomyces]MDF3141664.1 hypothetical protein [Streptomyces sp. T21Q-yed]WDF44995.1 hypothetical protein PBV52_21160 [Streptomyces sp. T12]
MIWTYCEQWSNLAETPMNPLTPEQAQARHASGELYTAVASPAEQSAPALRVAMRLDVPQGEPHPSDHPRPRRGISGVLSELDDEPVPVPPEERGAPPPPEGPPHAYLR